jgi:hypothetical protein
MAEYSKESNFDCHDLSIECDLHWDSEAHDIKLSPTRPFIRIRFGNSKIHLPDSRLEDRLGNINLYKEESSESQLSFILNLINSVDPIPLINVGSIIVNPIMFNVLPSTSMSYLELATLSRGLNGRI